MAGRYKVTTNSIMNLIIEHFKDGKSIRTIGKLVKIDISFWESVIFVDESKFNIFWSDGRIGVWRKPNEEFNPKNLLPTVKHGGGGIMVCGCFAASGMENLVSLKIMWTNTSILKENLKISAPKLGIQNTFKLYQDNDPKHTALNARL
ncbi:hypothetical protein AVEN_119454-1 [Araneus ventricosus]|uniref:Transposable element Tc1 transposase n=1 Tax=Araneus ventricosus TaxID=182803 RepID=A0A4Y2DKU0_ARAVE|nr:hypothetical protein AVEN_119454-1 [Araneus ventricosus]